MGKGFQNFMSKKDFHPSAWWNLKKVWEAQQKKDAEEKRQEELRIQHEKEQEMFNNKALLGDEKAKLGLSFMYDAPTGMTRREEPKEEPKFEWQRKYNAPREEWAKGNELIQDQPFGIQVRNVRCVKCHTWGHLNTDRECPLYNMSGNADNPGLVTNPSDVLKELRDSRKTEKAQKVEVNDSDEEEDATGYEGEAKPQAVSQVQLLTEMKDDHGFQFKRNILHNLRSEDVLTNIKTEKKEESEIEKFIAHMTPEQRKKVIAKTFGKKSKEYLMEKERQKEAKAVKKALKKAKKEASSSSDDSDSGNETKSSRMDSKSSRRSRKDDSYPKNRRRSRTPERRRRRDSSSPERNERRHKRTYSDRDSHHASSSSRRRESDECREKSRRDEERSRHSRRRSRSRSRSPIDRSRRR